MSETKQTNLQSWIIAGLVVVVAIYHFKDSGSADKPIDPQPQPVQSISKILNSAYKADRADKLAVLKDFSTKEFASDPEALKWFNDESTKRRIETFAPYIDRVGQAMNDGKVKELAAELEAGR